MPPPPPQQKKKEEDPEVLLRRKFLVKCRFRAVGRLVLANAYWLREDEEKYQGVDDVKRRVEQAVRSKAKPQLLKLNDKALLNKPAADRTIVEKHYLYRILGGLKCFKRYPTNVKRKLAAVTYFKYYGPNRVIVKQHHEGHALYFIVTGDVSVTQSVWDGLLQQYQSVEMRVMHAGDMFGEVSLLHNIPRTATCTSLSHCELLAVLKEDFTSVIQVSIQKQWDEVRLAMSKFTYFNTLDEVSLREGCIAAKLKSYATDETILGDGCGIQNYVYFVLSGKCQVIESLQVIVTKHVGKKSYKLYDNYVPKEESELDIDAKYFAAYKTKSLSKTNHAHQSLKNFDTSEVFLRLPSKTYKDNSFEMSTRFETESPTVEKIPNLQTVFMQVCEYKAGASFGFGENMRDRRIVAETPVSCLLLPMVWLLQKNTANIWTRIQYFLEKTIPTKKQLFQEFVKSCRWKEFCNQQVHDIVCRSKATHYTSIHDVPYSIRIEEYYDI